MSRIRVGIAFAATLCAAAPVVAGEVTGTGESIEIHARTECAFSGLNDNDGDPRDPGGFTQNYGTNVTFGLNPQDWDPNGSGFQVIPGFACNPNRWTDLHEEE